MIDVCLLGTGGMMPLPYRYLTSLLLRYNGHSILIDCGEGTQIALKEKGWSANPIDLMLFTHYHADHISGLPGMLLTIGNSDRTEPLVMVGPKGLARVANALRTIAPELPFEIVYHELTEAEEEFNYFGLTFRAFRVNHSVVCYGYTAELPRIGRFNVEKARELGIPQKYWNPLQKGQTVELPEGTYTPDMVLGEARKGLKITYCTDTRPTDRIVKFAEGSDLFICEGMYGEPDKQEKAIEHRHMTFKEAATMAAQAGVTEMWLTHYSPSLSRPEPFMKEVQAIFPGAVAGKDGMSKELIFEQD